MLKETVYRARTILSRNEVLLCPDSTSSFFHFLVLCRSKKWADVWLKKTKLGMEWSCNSVDGDGDWGCVFHKGDHSKPYCSHSLACAMKKERLERMRL